MTYFALHAEKWLDGSTRMELRHDERACFIDMLARATQTGADPPGQIYYVNEEHLAQQVKVPLDLLQRTLESCKKTKKIKISQKKSEGVLVLSMLNWEKYQHIWMHQRAYRQRQKEKKEKQNKLLKPGTKKHNVGITGDVALGDRRGEEKDRISEENIGEKERGFPSHPREQFLYLLKEFSEENLYPFDEAADGQVFDLCLKRYPHVDPIREVEKKIAYWKQNPGTLRSKGKSPREQLVEFFAMEEKYQAGDPLPQEE